jgi:hypothetical protein
MMSNESIFNFMRPAISRCGGEEEEDGLWECMVGNVDVVEYVCLDRIVFHLLLLMMTILLSDSLRWKRN